MLVLTKNDKLIAAVCRIKSHHKNVGNLVPKVIYHNENTDICGVFYDADKNNAEKFAIRIKFLIFASYKSFVAGG